MEKGLIITEYDGFYAVEFCNESVGMTLFISENKKECEKKLEEIKNDNNSK
ncbi:MAG TPA: hypothetical protein PLZ84_08640 [Clostridia bacterium]|nr:hypothetical protein [Clostridia bacterium]